MTTNYQSTPKNLSILDIQSTNQSSLMELPESAKGLIGASVSKNTLKACQKALIGFDSFLAGRAGSDDNLSEYLNLMHDRGLAPATASLVVAAVKFRVKITNGKPIAGQITDRVLAGYRRDAVGRGRGQVRGLNWSESDTIAAVSANGDRKVAGLRDAAIVALMSDGLLRVSELVALDVDHLTHEAGGTGRLLIVKSKTDQEAQGAVLFVGVQTVSRINAWLKAAMHATGPFFCRVRRGGHATCERITATSIRRIVKSRCANAGIDAAKVSSHSFRVGGVQSLAGAGASIADMQTAGRWKSADMPGHYCRGQLAGRGAVARLRYGY